MEKIVDEGPRPAHFRQWTQPTNVYQQQESSREMEITCLGSSLILESDILPEGRGGHAFNMVQTSETQQEKMKNASGEARREYP